MNLKTISKISDKIAQILKLEAVLAILTFLSMGLTTETTDTSWMLRQILGYMLIAIIDTAILYVIVIGLYLMLYIHKLNPVLKYQEKIEGKIKAMTDIGGTLEMFKTSNSLEKEMIKLEIESLLNLGTLTYNEIHILNKIIIERICLLERTDNYLNSIIDYVCKHKLSRRKVNKLMESIAPNIDKDIGMFDISGITKADIYAYKKEISIKHEQNLRFDAMTEIIKKIFKGLRLLFYLF